MTLSLFNIFCSRDVYIAIYYRADDAQQVLYFLWPKTVANSLFFPCPFLFPHTLFRIPTFSYPLLPYHSLPSITVPECHFLSTIFLSFQLSPSSPFFHSIQQPLSPVITYPVFHSSANSFSPPFSFSIPQPSLSLFPFSHPLSTPPLSLHSSAWAVMKRSPINACPLDALLITPLFI